MGQQEHRRCAAGHASSCTPMLTAAHPLGRGSPPCTLQPMHPLPCTAPAVFPQHTPTPAPSASNQIKVWRPGIDPIAEGEELDYDPTAYDCLHKFTLEWPCLSFDLIRDDLGAPRSTFPHTMFMVAGTQAAGPRQNYLALLKLDQLGQGRCVVNQPELG